MYATTAEVETNIGRTLSATEAGQATLWIGWAERTIAARMGGLTLLTSTCSTW